MLSQVPKICKHDRRHKYIVYRTAQIPHPHLCAVSITIKIHCVLLSLSSETLKKKTIHFIVNLQTVSRF